MHTVCSLILFNTTVMAQCFLRKRLDKRKLSQRLPEIRIISSSQKYNILHLSNKTEVLFFTTVLVLSTVLKMCNVFIHCAIPLPNKNLVLEVCCPTIMKKRLRAAARLCFNILSEATEREGVTMVSD